MERGNGSGVPATWAQLLRTEAAHIWDGVGCVMTPSAVPTMANASPHAYQQLDDILSQGLCHF